MTTNYPLDMAGTNPANIVRDEMHTVSGSELGSSAFIVPNFGPFFTNDFEATITVNDVERPLVEGVDFTFEVQYVAATRQTAKAVYAAITPVNLDRRGIITLKKYRTLGGNQVTDRYLILTHLAERVYNPRTVYFDTIMGIPSVLPPSRHPHVFNEMYGQGPLINKLTEIRDAILQNSSLTQAEIRRFLGIIGDTTLANILMASGGTMTGPLILNGDPQEPNSAVNKAYVDANFLSRSDYANVMSGYYNTTEINVRFDNVLHKTGGVMTGPITLHADPTEDAQAATKRYVDQLYNNMSNEVSDLLSQIGSIGGDYVSKTEFETAIGELMIRMGTFGHG